jgi:hypothetical protein
MLFLIVLCALSSEERRVLRLIMSWAARFVDGEGGVASTVVGCTDAMPRRRARWLEGY